MARTLPFHSIMSRPLRYQERPGALFEVTDRTLQGRFLLRPSAKLNDLVLGVIGRALTLYPVQLYLFVVVSNHLHLILATPDTKALADFMCFIKSNIAREAGRLHGWREKFWGRRYTAIPILDEPALIQRARYILSHGCKENLVARPGDWPGIHCVDALTQGRLLIGRWRDRTGEYEARRAAGPYRPADFVKPYEVPLTPLPFLAGESEPRQRAFWRALTREVEVETGARLTREKSRVLGKKAICAQDPHAHPEQPHRGPRPFCHAASRLLIGLYRQAYALFVEAYRQAHDGLKRTKRKTLANFPPDCYIPPMPYQAREGSPACG